MDWLADLGGLDCASGPCSGDCDSRAGSYMGQEWPRCPVRCVRDDWRLTAVRHLDQHAAVGIPPGDPDSYAAWVAPLWAELRAAKAGRSAQER